MPLGLLGKKLGNTRVYDARGLMTPVTVVLAGGGGVPVMDVSTCVTVDTTGAVVLVTGAST